MENIDTKAINMLKDLENKSGRKILGKLITLYTESTPDIVSNLYELLEKNQFEEIAREAHSLKSSSANLGVVLISQTCQTIESRIHDEQQYTRDEIYELIQSVEERLQPTLKDLQALSD